MQERPDPFGWEHHRMLIITELNAGDPFVFPWHMKAGICTFTLFCFGLSWISNLSNCELLVRTCVRSELSWSSCEILKQGTWLRAHQLMGPPPLIRLPSVPHNNPPCLLIKTFIHSRLVLDTQIKDVEKNMPRRGWGIADGWNEACFKRIKKKKKEHLRVKYVLFTWTHHATA